MSVPKLGAILLRGSDAEWRENVALFKRMRGEVAKSLLPLSHVQALVLRYRHQLQVLKTIIGLVTVDVMHGLIRPQSATKMLFHHITMFGYRATARNAHANITVRAKPTSALPLHRFRTNKGLLEFVITRLAAKTGTSWLHFVGVAVERRAASLASTLDLATSPIGSIRPGLGFHRTGLTTELTVTSGNVRCTRKEGGFAVEASALNFGRLGILRGHRSYPFDVTPGVFAALPGIFMSSSNYTKQSGIPYANA